MAFIHHFVGVVITLGSLITTIASTCNHKFPGLVATTLIDGTCYVFVTTQLKDYDDAEEVCEYHDGTLALVKTHRINSILSKSLRYNGLEGEFWIGLNDKQDENVFVWEDGTRAQYNTFGFLHSLFNRVLDIFHRKNCVAMDNAGKWHTFRCKSSSFLIFFGHDARRNFICEFNNLEQDIGSSRTIEKFTTDSDTTTTVTTPMMTTEELTTTAYFYTTTKKALVTTAKPFSTTTEPLATTTETLVTTTKPLITTTNPLVTTATPPSTTTKSLTTTTESLVTTTEALVTTTESLSSTTRSPDIIAEAPETACPPLECNLDCGLSGYKSNAQTKCLTCACNQSFF